MSVSYLKIFNFKHSLNIIYLGTLHIQDQYNRKQLKFNEEKLKAWAKSASRKNAYSTILILKSIKFRGPCDDLSIEQDEEFTESLK